MKKKFFFFAMFMSIAASAQITNVTPASANYATQTVSFRVWWDAGSRNATHLSKIWVWVDYLAINDNNTTSGNTWTRALVSGTPTANAGTPSLESGNDKGFWLQGSSGSYSATVTVKLTGVPDKFNWCAYVSDYPPNITFSTQRDLTMTGTIPFIITYTDNSTVTVNDKSFQLASGKTFKNITDATFCPVYVNNTVNGIIPTVGTDQGSTAISCSGSTLYVQSAANGTSPWLPNNNCPEGWRWPTYTEMKCFWAAGYPPNMNYVWNSNEYSASLAWSMKPCCNSQSLCWSETGYPATEYAAYYNYTLVACNICGNPCVPVYMVALPKTASVAVRCVKN